MFTLSFKSGNDDPKRNLFDRYYLPLIEIKDFNALIDNKPFFDQPVKTNKLIEMSRNDDYKTGNLLDFSYHRNYKFIGIHSSRQTNTNIPQQINLQEN